MAYVSVPKDLTKVKEKFLFNLTKRQVVCFGSGALAGLPAFFLLKDHIGTSLASRSNPSRLIPVRRCQRLSTKTFRAIGEIQ